MYKRGQLDKVHWVQLLRDLFKVYLMISARASADFIDNIQNLVTEYVKLSAYSVGISDLIGDEKTNAKIAELFKRRCKS